MEGVLYIIQNSTAPAARAAPASSTEWRAAAVGGDGEQIGIQTIFLNEHTQGKPNNSLNML
jgi:hypothetical protein